MGFWANKGNSSITAADLLALRNLNLVNENGSPFDPISAGQIKTFLRSSRST
jgi:hypothetical protein